jgi:tetratricopeptide (TPR) repeat protein
MVQPVSTRPSTTGGSLLLQIGSFDFLSDPLGPIVAALVAILVSTWAAIRNELIRSYLQSVGDRVRIYTERNRESDEMRYRAGVLVTNLLWRVLFRHLGEDPVKRITKELRADGFRWLSAAEVEEGTLDRLHCWRRPFKFREIHEGFAIDRERVRPDGRENVTEALIDGLDGGGVDAVVGYPGSGKSTICKAVATRWYDRDGLGPVFYRESGEGGEISEPRAFGERIEVGKRVGPVLVVVEDAVRPDAAPIFDTIREYQGDEDVSFLLDAREHEWEPESFERILEMRVDRLDTSRGRALRGLPSEVDRHGVPPLDVREVERAIERFEKVTDRKVREDAQRILRRIRLEEEDVSAGGRRSGMWPSPMLLLTYHFPIGARKSDGEKKATTLRGNVREAFQTIEKPDTESLSNETSNLLCEVALLVNILNAARIGVYKELLYALADADEEYDKIEHLTSELNGMILFGRSSGTRYWSNHPLWSELYLEEFRDRNGNREDWARKRFETCVNALFRVVDEDVRRERIQTELSQSTEEFRQIEADPTERADAYVEKIFELGIARPKLAPLFGTSEYSEIEIPENCSAWTRAYCSIYRSEMYEILGEYKKAKKEVDVFRIAMMESGADEKRAEATYLLKKGRIHSKENRFGLANQNFNRSIDIFREISDQHGEAEALHNLGNIAYEKIDYQAAQEYYKECLEIRRELNDRRGEGETLNNLGNIAYERNDDQTAREYYDKSLRIKRELDDRRGEAATLHNLGGIALRQKEYSTACKRCNESLKINRELGDRRGEAETLNSLGNVSYEKDDDQTAQEYYEDSLEIMRELGDRRGKARTLHNLGGVAYRQKDYSTAGKLFKDSLEIKRELEPPRGEEDTHRRGEAETLNSLGNIAHEQNDYRTAREYYEDSLKIANEIDDIRLALKVLDNLVSSCRADEDEESAIKWCRTAISIIDDSNLSLAGKRKTFESYLDELQDLDENER